MRWTIVVGFVVLLTVGTSVAARAKDISDYPLRISIVETRWERNSHGGVVGSGHGNLVESDSVRGFDYTFSCDEPFNASQGNGVYPAKWNKAESRLELFGTRIGDAKKHDTCELKVTMMNLVYGLQDGHLVTYNVEQWNKVLADRRMLAQHNHPTDTDATHYPLQVAILDVQWQVSPLTGGVAGTGRGNVRNGASSIAFDFAALCPARLTVTPEGRVYSARWEQEGARLLILSHNIGDAQADHTCELRTESHPTQVYLRNTTTGIVRAVSQEEFTHRAASAAPSGPSISPAAPTPVAPKAPSATLTNSDVIAMANAGLSTDIILAKMNSAACNFDTSPDALRQLKVAHVPDAIVLEMIKRQSH